MNIKLMIRSIMEALKLGVSMSDKDKMVGYFLCCFGGTFGNWGKLKLKTEI